MAANTASFLCANFLAFPLFIILLSARQQMAAANDDLLNTVCSTSKNPSFCLKSLKSDPRSAAADARGLAEIAIDMARATTARTLRTIGSLVRKEKNPQWNKQYALCSVSYDNVVGYVEAAKGSLRTQDYQSLSIQASAIASEVDECEKSLKVPPPDSSAIRLASRILENLSNIIYEITFLL